MYELWFLLEKTIKFIYDKQNSRKWGSGNS